MTPEPTVIVIDDSATSCRVMEEILQKEGYRVKVARDGREGVQMVVQKVPHCVILDVVLPGMSGYEVCRYLRSQALGLRDLPIIMVSTKNTPIDKTWALRQGATHYLVKPFDEHEFAKVVKEAIASYEPSASMSRANLPRVTPPPTKQAQEQIPQERFRAPAKHVQEQESQERFRASGKVVESRPPSAEDPARKHRPPPQQEDALPLYKLIPTRNQGTDFMWERSPHFLSTINPQARLLYSTIDGKQDIETLCRTTRMSQEDVIRALRSLLMQHRVRLLEPGGRAINNVNFGSSEPRNNRP